MDQPPKTELEINRDETAGSLERKESLIYRRLAGQIATKYLSIEYKDRSKDPNQDMELVLQNIHPKPEVKFFRIENRKDLRNNREFNVNIAPDVGGDFAFLQFPGRNEVYAFPVKPSEWSSFTYTVMNSFFDGVSAATEVESLDRIVFCAEWEPQGQSQTATGPIYTYKPKARGAIQMKGRPDVLNIKYIKGENPFSGVNLGSLDEEVSKRITHEEVVDEEKEDPTPKESEILEQPPQELTQPEGDGQQIEAEAEDQETVEPVTGMMIDGVEYSIGSIVKNIKHFSDTKTYTIIRFDTDRKRAYYGEGFQDFIKFEDLQLVQDNAPQESPAETRQKTETPAVEAMPATRDERVEKHILEAQETAKNIGKTKNRLAEIEARIAQLEKAIADRKKGL